jgi:ribonuclease HI
MAQQKYYVVWEGFVPGIYTSWKDCVLQIKGYGGAKYMSFETREEAKRAFARSPREYIGKDVRPQTEWRTPREVIKDSLAVDAACSGNPGPMEYRGVDLVKQEEVFHVGPMMGTNNIGEFLALVHGLAMLNAAGFHDKPIYTDSLNAIKWVEKKKCRTWLERTAETEELFRIIERAETWLKENTYTNPIIKWQTRKWGEIPADFGRKKG